MPSASTGQAEPTLPENKSIQAIGAARDQPVL